LENDKLIDILNYIKKLDSFRNAYKLTIPVSIVSAKEFLKTKNNKHLFKIINV